MPVETQAQDGSGDHGTVRCFKCPKERRGSDAGWHFMDLENPRGGLHRYRVYVCPRDYLGFAAAERARWLPVGNGSGGSTDPGPPAVPASVRGPDALVAVLSLRGLTGWALLVRDVAEGRVRRLHLRQLPADPEIRQALVAYLHSAGAEFTIDRSLRWVSGIEVAASHNRPSA